MYDHHSVGESSSGEIAWYTRCLHENLISRCPLSIPTSCKAQFVAYYWMMYTYRSRRCQVHSHHEQYSWWMLAIGYSHAWWADGMMEYSSTTQCRSI